MDLKKCEICNTTLQYIDNYKNNLTYLKCPKCYETDTRETGVTVQERIEQGYARYIRREEKIAEYMHEKLMNNDE